MKDQTKSEHLVEVRLLLRKLHVFELDHGGEGHVFRL